MYLTYVKQQHVVIPLECKKGSPREIRLGIIDYSQMNIQQVVNSMILLYMWNIPHLNRSITKFDWSSNDEWNSKSKIEDRQKNKKKIETNQQQQQKNTQNWSFAL